MILTQINKRGAPHANLQSDRSCARICYMIVK